MACHTNYTVGWICAISTEYIAARAFLDEEHKQVEQVSTNDNNVYTLGRMGAHNIVIAVLPDGGYGISSAASVARDMVHTFPNIRIGLMVGIGGGAPSPQHDIRLGDIVVSSPQGAKGGVFQYDFGKTIQGQVFKPTGFLNQPPGLLRTAVAVTRSHYESDGHTLAQDIIDILQVKPRLRKKYSRPNPSSDRLYHAEVVHTGRDCSGCAVNCGTGQSSLVLRSERTDEEDDPAIHYGIIASGNQLMKDALLRDRLSAEQGILCFEMEAAGLMNHFPCLVIRGICDYSDSHKNKEWQGYAAMTAAAYAKDLLRRISPSTVEAEKKIGDLLSGLNKVAQEHRDIAQKQLEMQKDQARKIMSEKEQECHQLFRLTATDRDATYEWYKDRVDARVESTCLWFLRHEHFQAWMNQKCGPLLVSADPGCGKTVLAKYLIDHVLPSPGATVCYFFFKDQDQNTVRQALCAVLHQLFSQKPSLIQYAMAQYRTDGKGMIMSTESLWTVLKSAINDPHAGAIIIVLDALDECAESEFTSLIQKVERQFSSNQSSYGNLKYLLTSRPYEQIVSKFHVLTDDFPNIRIPGEEESEMISQEVNHVITYRVNELSKKKRLSSTIKSYLEKRLQETTHRTYLWVYLVFDYLEKEDFKKTLKGIESIISTLPRSINEAYQQILSRSKQDPMTLRKILSIILVATRPLTLCEMNIAVNVDDTLRSFSELDLEDEEDFKLTLRSWCGLFVSIHHGKIYFLHQTAREFLLADMGLTPKHSDLHWHQSITTRQAHTVLAEVCVLYLKIFNSDLDLLINSSKEPDQIVENHLFLNYSAKAWGAHFREANIFDDATIAPFAAEICKSGSKSYSAWFEIYWNSSSKAGSADFHHGLFGKEDFYSPDGLTDLMLASYFGHQALVKLLLAKGSDIHRENRKGWTALSWAVEENHPAIVELLLSAGAHVDHKYIVRYSEEHCLPRGNGRYYYYNGFPCQHPDSDGSSDSGRCYINGERERTPLSRAAEKGSDVQVVELLLYLGKANASWKDEKGWTPLSWAVEGGHWTVVKLLLKAAAKVHYEYMVPFEKYKEYESTTPLSRAAEKGDELSVKLLIDTGKTDIDWKDDKGWSALSWAVEAGHAGVVKVLLPAGATVNFTYNVRSLEVAEYACSEHEARASYRGKIYRRTPLTRASEKGYISVVQLLLERGETIVDGKDEKAWTPLCWAVEGNHWDVASLLVQAGAQADWKYKAFDDFAYHWRTPLSQAQEKAQEAVVKLMLERNHSSYSVLPCETTKLQRPAGLGPPKIRGQEAREEGRDQDTDGVLRERPSALPEGNFELSVPVSKANPRKRPASF